jgi:hypothetical protein
MESAKPGRSSHAKGGPVNKQFHFRRSLEKLTSYLVVVASYHGDLDVHLPEAFPLRAHLHHRGNMSCTQGQSDTEANYSVHEDIRQISRYLKVAPFARDAACTKKTGCSTGKTHSD